MAAPGWIQRLRVLVPAVVLMAAALPAAGSQTVYQGDIGGSAVTVVIDSYNSVVRGTYFYDRHRTPIRLRPTLSHGARDAALHEFVLGLDEVDTAGLPSARLRFHQTGFGPHQPQVTGTWTDYRSGRSLPLRLRQVAYLDHGGNRPAGPWPLLQAVSTERFYFRVPVDAGAAVSEVHVMEKTGGTLFQRLPLATPVCEAGIDTVQLGLERGRVQLRVGGSEQCGGPAEAEIELPG